MASKVLSNPDFGADAQYIGNLKWLLADLWIHKFKFPKKISILQYPPGHTFEQ